MALSKQSEKDRAVDNVNHPSHYEKGCSLECIEVMRVTFGKRAVYDFCLCNSFKYMWRYKSKNGIEDLEKAKWYLDYISHDIEAIEDRELDEIDREAANKCDDLRQLLININDKISNGGGLISV